MANTKKIAADISEIIAAKTNELSVEECKEVLLEVKSLCVLQIMAIDDGEID